MAWGDRFPLHRAAIEGDADMVRTLIHEDFSPSAKDDDSWTPLHYACWHGKETVVRVLLEDWQGAPAEPTDQGSTALHFAARNGYPEVVKVLLACPVVDVNGIDGDGETALSLCEKLQLNAWEEVSRILRNPEGKSLCLGPITAAQDLAGEGLRF